MDAITELSTGIAVYLAAIAAAIVLIFALGELRSDWKAQRAQFASAFCVVLIGITYRQGVAYYFWKIYPSMRLASLDDIQLQIVIGNVLIIIGMAWVIRSVTLNRAGEWAWLVSITAALALVAMPWPGLI